MEGRWTRSTVLARDFDGAIYLQTVSPGTGMLADGPMRVLRVFGFFVQHMIGTAIVLNFLGGLLVDWCVSIHSSPAHG